MRYFKEFDSIRWARSRQPAPRRGLLTLAATALLLMGAGSAQANTIFEGDQTSLLVTSFFFLTDAGFDLAPLGDAVIGNDVVRDQNNGEFRKLAAFPITGGGVNSVTGDVLIEHGDSGLALSTAGPANVVALEDFEIFLDGSPSGGLLGQLFARVSVNGGTPLENVPIFDVTECGLGVEPACIDSDDSRILNGLRLGLTEGAASLLNEVFLTDAFAGGTQVGVARVDVRVVPEPGTLILTSLGLVGLGLASRRQPRARG
jgi:hypothetical protein